MFGLYGGITYIKIKLIERIKFDEFKLETAGLFELFQRIKLFETESNLLRRTSF